MNTITDIASRKLTVTIGSDHGGLELKNAVAALRGVLQATKQRGNE